MTGTEERYIIAVDMDGTLLNSHGHVTKRTAETLQRLLDLGHYVTPASGRPFPLLPGEVTGLKGISYGVLENGAVVWDWKNRCALDATCLPEGMAHRLLLDVQAESLRRQTNIRYYVEFFSQGKAYADAGDISEFENAGIAGNFAEYMLNGHVFLENLPEQKEFLNMAEKLNIYFEDENFSAEFREKWKRTPELYVTTSVSGNTEFTAPGVNKGAGLRILMKRLAVPAERVIAIGDNDNDLEMFSVAGHAVAMGNAAPNIKTAANHQTTDNDHDGAAVFLEQFFQL